MIATTKLRLRTLKSEFVLHTFEAVFVLCGTVLTKLCVKVHDGLGAVEEIALPLPSCFTHRVAKPLDQVLKVLYVYIGLVTIQHLLDSVLAIDSWREEIVAGDWLGVRFDIFILRRIDHVKHLVVVKESRHEKCVCQR